MPSSSPKGTYKETLKVNFSKYIYLFKNKNLKFLVLHVSCLIFSQKKDIPRICVEENIVKKARELVTLPQNTTKKAHTKETQGGYGERK